MIKDVTLNQL